MISSRFVLAGTLLAIFLVSLGDVLWHGHFGDGNRMRWATDDINSAPGLTSLINLDVKVRNREGHVSGFVDTEEERYRVTRAALRTPGFLTIVNDVRVDTMLVELLDRLKALIAADPTKGEFSYILTDPHSVTLQGWVPKDEADLKEAIVALVQRVPGVRRVHDNMTLGRGDIQQAQADIFEIMRAKNIYFDYNKSTIRPESVESVRRIAGVFAKYPDVHTRVEGHTDWIASEAYNQKLSEARAQSVRDALVEAGMDPARIHTKGFGEGRPIAPNTTPEGRADNRRIEFRLWESGQAPPQD